VVARALLVVPLLAGGACTLVLDPDNLPPPTDARAIDAPTDPDLLTINGATPAMIPEGTGAAGGRPALVVLTGTSFVQDATITAAIGGGEPITILPASIKHAVSVDGTSLGITLPIPVIDTLARGATRPLTITVAQGEVERSISSVLISGLAELTLPGRVDDPTYSQITVSAATHLAGDDAIRLEATGGIAIDAVLDGNAVGATPGPNGCAGGNGGADGACTPGGARTGVVALTGGGGSFGSVGDTGGGGGGAPGMRTGARSLVPIGGSNLVAGNRGNRGGGGAGAGLGGRGGAGGGVLYLAAGGDLTIAATGRIEARGGEGTAARAGGGGGAGGAIVLRTGGTFTAGGGSVIAPGGAGGGNGGKGGDGRIRADAAGGNPAGAAVPTELRGPSWAKANRLLVDESLATFTLTLLGQPGQTFSLRLNDGALTTTATPNAGDSVAVGNLPLLRGRNQLCALAEAGSLEPESLACVELFYTGR
jgi:hypothetical protein